MGEDLSFCTASMLDVNDANRFKDGIALRTS